MADKKPKNTKSGREDSKSEFVPVLETKRGKNPSILPRIRRRIRRKNEPDSRS